MSQGKTVELEKKTLKESESMYNIKSVSKINLKKSWAQVCNVAEIVTYMVSLRAVLHYNSDY